MLSIYRFRDFPALPSCNSECEKRTMGISEQPEICITLLNVTYLIPN